MDRKIICLVMILLCIAMLVFLCASEVNPIGATGCSIKINWWSIGGRCWRYCRGSNGGWCYTGQGCLGYEEGCAWLYTCANYSCEGADGGCVVKC